MLPTDSGKEAAFFADWLLPLSQANLRRGVAYLKRDGGADSYWGEVATRTGGLEKLAPDACDASALLEALDLHWSRNGDEDLPRLRPELHKLLRAIGSAAPAATDESVVAEFVYPLY